MLPTTASFERRALNRVTFGARDVDEAYAQQIGWSNWVAEQLAAPAGDDPALAAFLANQTMPISYGASSSTTNPGWPAVTEVRPLNYLGASTTDLWALEAGNNSSVSPSEVYRVRQELAAATWIRNTQSKWQLREFMTDFWHNHFNIGKNAHETATVELPIYDAQVIRPNVFGNFRQLLGAVANSTSMMIYLDNWLSKASVPNENYSREVLELHTLGAGVYHGVVSDETPATQSGDYVATSGFTDADVTQASRCLSGWTVSNGQYAGMGRVLPIDGSFAYNPLMHNTTAGMFMGVDMSQITGSMAQGNAVLDIAGYHPATAAFIVNKLAVRLFGDTPPPAVIQRGLATWMAAQEAPDQIAQVLTAMLVDGNEIGTSPAQKLRRPYEHLMALFRTTDAVVNASTLMTSAFDPVTDFLFAWLPPNGRPDYNAYWLSTGAIMAMWNNAMTWQAMSQIQTSLSAQTPATVRNLPEATIEYWVARMVGFSLSSAGMQGLLADQAGTNGTAYILATGADAESSFRRLIGLISQAPEFMYR